MSPLSLSYAELKVLCEELNVKVADFTVTGCFPNDLKRFYLILCGEPHQQSLFFCFTPPLLRFHFTSAYPSTQTSHPLNAFLKGTSFKEAHLLNEDRVMQMMFSSSRETFLFLVEFFPKRPNYYLLKEDETILFSLYPSPQSHYQSPPQHPYKSSHPPRWFSHQDVERAYTDYEKIWAFKQEKHKLNTTVSQSIKKLERKQQTLAQALQECQNWEQIQHEGELIKAHLASINKKQVSVEVWDWLIEGSRLLTLDPSKTVQENMVDRFRRAKKLERGKIPLQHQLEHIHIQLNQLEQLCQTLQDVHTQEELNTWHSQSESILSRLTHRPLRADGTLSRARPLSRIYIEYFSANGTPIWVGRNAKANEQLTFQLARGRDWWLHVSGCPGSHVIIRYANDQPPDQETLEDAMQLALYHSKARNQGEGEICLTQRKYISRSGQKGKVGQVQISKHRTMWVRLHLARYEALKLNRAYN
jgi:predicted ribosome quality control (RQC) complex YloA/Tae2 family protein